MIRKFLLKLLAPKSVSFEQFAEDLKKEANGRYHSVRVERLEHSDGSFYYRFEGYIDPRRLYVGSTPEEVLEQFRPKKKEVNTKEILD